jgi:hypothetical protein
MAIRDLIQAKTLKYGVLFNTSRFIVILAVLIVCASCSSENNNGSSPVITMGITWKYRSNASPWSVSTELTILDPQYNNYIRSYVPQVNYDGSEHNAILISQASDHTSLSASNTLISIYLRRESGARIVLILENKVPVEVHLNDGEPGELNCLDVVGLPARRHVFEAGRYVIDVTKEGGETVLDTNLPPNN